jgi:Lanthionine synthetase C-like protein
VLYTPASHERLTAEPWNADRVRGAIRSIAAETENAFDDGWDSHPLDSEQGRFRTIYGGGAGVVDALRRLREGGVIDLQRDYVPYLEHSLEAPADYPDENPRRSWWVGEVGIRLVLQRLAPSAENLDELALRISENARDERRELMWGSAGTMLAARELGLGELWAESAEWLRGQRDADGLWEQDLFGTRVRYLGPAHGFAGCVLALGDDPLAGDVARNFAVEEDGLANWAPVAGDELASRRDGSIRVQWCHGAPGIVTSLGDLLDEDLALAAGELTWLAGPVAKGANLCHGTAGNGHAFLTLLARTGDERWLARARAFAMHSVEQVERARAAHGRYRYALWSGDLGTALYLADCLEGAGALPLP